LLTQREIQERQMRSCEGSHPANYKNCMVYKDLRKNFFPTLRRKVVTSQSQTRTEPTNTQIRHVQLGRLYALVARTDSKQSNTNQNGQEKQGKTFPNLKQHITIIQDIGITKYNEKIYGKNGYNL